MIRAALRRIELLADFHDWELDRLRAMMRDERVPAGTTFIRQGDTASARSASAFLCVAGTVRVTRARPDGSVAVDTRLPPGAFVGVVGLLLDHARSASCIADSDVRLLAIDRATFESMYDADSRLAVKFQLVVARQLAQDLRRTNRALSTTATGRHGQPPRPE